MDKADRAYLPYVASVIALAVVVISLAVSAFYFEKQRYLERAQVATSNIVQLQVQNVGNLFDKVDIALQSGALFHQHQHLGGSFNQEELNDYLKNLESVIPEVDGIRVLDKDGLVRYGNNIPTSPRTNLSDRNFYLKAKDDANANGALIIDGPLYARIARKWVVVFARRLNNADGSFAGVIYANLATSQLEKILSSTVLGPHGAATLRTADLALVHRVPDTKNAVGSKKVSAELQAAIAANPEGGDYVAETAIDGIERSNAYRTIGKYPFIIIVGLATQDYLGSSRQNIFIILILSLVTILVSAVAGYRSYRSHRQLALDLRERNELNQTLSDTLLERDQLNAALTLKAREAEAASKAKSAFLANMSHELRTPLHQMNGLAQLISREPLSARQIERVKALEGSVHLMTSLVDTVLKLTQIEAGSLDLSEEPFELADLVNPAVAKFAEEAAAKRLSLKIHDLPPVRGLVGDKRHIQQALMNYLSNAVRFTQAGGIDVMLRVLHEDESSALMQFEVRDTGIGIKPEDQPRLFNIFEQVDNSSTRQHGGLGAGLAITRKIAESLGGGAGCESIYGQGSTFWFSVRLKKLLPASA